MDTPYWERLQYVDTRIQALISYAVAGDDRLARQAIEAFNNSRIADGLTQSRYPSSLVQIIPTLSLLWVGMVHDFWMCRGDPDFVRAQLAGTRAVLDWCESVAALLPKPFPWT
jgi:alpha-L-rhamnosidase